MFFLFSTVFITEFTELSSIHIPLRIIMASTAVNMVRLFVINNVFYISYTLISVGKVLLTTFSFEYFVSTFYF